MTSKGVDLPIFELPVVLLPGELLPLHVFEERYKLMIADCLEAGEPFGVVLRDDDGNARRVGCEARVTEVVERFDDGRLNIVVVGERPFRVLDRYEATGYPAGEVEPIAAEPEEEDAAGAADAARSAFADLVARVSGEAPPAEDVAGEDAYALAARVELPPETKQRLLELRSESERMGVLKRAFGALLGAIDRSERIAEQARMNGRVIVPDDLAGE